jgi:hypothetical protein
VGAKTTTLPAAALALGLALYSNREHLRRLARPLAIAAVAGIAVGGIWYLRNLVTHGSPFWPVVAAPWGDDQPSGIAAVDTPFIRHPWHTIDLAGHLYLERFGGGVLLIVGGLLVPFVARERRVALTALAVAGGLVLWSFSFQTGAGPLDLFGVLAFSSTRYLLPVVVVAALALGLAAAEDRRYAAPMGVLAAATLINLVETLQLDNWAAPPAVIPAAGCAAGALLAVGAARIAQVPRSWVRPVAAAVVLGVAATLAIPAAGFVERHAATNPWLTGGVTRWMSHDPAYRARPTDVETTASMIGPLAGDRLQHRLAMVSLPLSCANATARARRAWLVVNAKGPAAQVQRCLGVQPAFADRFFSVFRPGAPKTASATHNPPRRTKTYNGDIGRTGFARKVLTPQFQDTYDLSKSDGAVTITAPSTNAGTNTRQVFWPKSSAPLTNSRVCATWAYATTPMAQEGLALHAVAARGTRRAITVTKNIIYGVTWVFNVLVWDSTSDEDLRGVAQFNMGNVLIKDGAVRPFPWRVCTQVRARTLTFKLWLPNRQDEPAWDDPRHTRRTSLPTGYTTPGKTGWYVGHIPPGGAVKYTNLSISSDK